MNGNGRIAMFGNAAPAQVLPNSQARSDPEGKTVDRLNIAQHLNRRLFLARAGVSLGSMALGSLLNGDRIRAATGPQTVGDGGLPGLPHFAPKVRRVIYLFQSGAPSQMDLFDYKPALRDKRGIELPPSVRM